MPGDLQLCTFLVEETVEFTTVSFPESDAVAAGPPHLHTPAQHPGDLLSIPALKLTAKQVISVVRPRVAQFFSSKSLRHEHFKQHEFKVSR